MWLGGYMISVREIRGLESSLSAVPRKTGVLTQDVCLALAKID